MLSNHIKWHNVTSPRDSVSHDDYEALQAKNLNLVLTKESNPQSVNTCKGCWYHS
jgi:hypothetical protein